MNSKISTIREFILTDEGISEESRNHLLKMLSELDNASEDSEPNSNQDSVWKSVGQSFENFEAKHPELVKTVSSITNNLSNSGL